MTSFEIQKYYQNGPKFRSIYLQNSEPDIVNHGDYVVNLAVYKSIGTNWIAFHLNSGVIYFDSLVVEHIPKEIKKFIGNKNIFKNIFRIQAYDLIMCGWILLNLIY